MKLQQHGCELYKDCCARRQVKPNETILHQIDSADLNMTVLDATNTFLGAAGTHALLDFVVQYRRLEQLLLPQNGLDLECVRHLCDVLVRGAHPRLCHVDLSRNDLTVPSVRLLWQTACTVPSLISVSVADCGVEQEWLERLERTIAANAELQRDGYLSYGPAREPPRSWQTVFLLLLGAPAHVQRYTRDVLPVVASYAAALRVRVAPLVVRPEDTRAQVGQKLARCREAHGNEGRTWCVVLVDAEHPLNAREQYALRQVLDEGPLPPLEPLRDKQGVRRGPQHRLVQTLFVYYANPANTATEVGCGVDSLSPVKWLRMAGIGAPTDDTPGQEENLAMYSEFVQEPACVLGSASYEIRCQSDLLVALETVHKEDTRQEEAKRGESTPLAIANNSGVASDGGGGDAEQEECHYEALQPRVSAVLRSYLREDERSSDGVEPSLDRVNVPLLLYGCRNVGKAALLSCLTKEYVTRSNTEGPQRQRRRIIELDVGTGNTSLIILLMRTLACLTGDYLEEQHQHPHGPFASVRQLCSAVRSAIEGFNGPPTVLLLPRIDAVDSCGLPPTVVVDWIPTRCPKDLRLIMTLTTESPLLPSLRQRIPQPLEVLVAPFNEDGRLAVFRRCLAQQKVSLPGLTHAESSLENGLRALPASSSAGAGETQPERTAAEEAYLAKDGCTSLLFARLAAACARAAGPPGDASQRSTRATAPFDAAAFVEDSIPGTVEEAIVAAAALAATTCGSETVHCLLGCLCVAPLPVPELRMICEDIGGCAPQTTVPALLELVDAGLVSWRADSTVYVTEEMARRVLSASYCGSEEMGRCKTMVESHLYRVVTTHSPEAVDAFRYLIPIMIEGGNFELASSLLLANTPVLDSLMFADTNAFDPVSGGGAAPNQLYILDGLFRLLAARELLVQMAAVPSASEGDDVDTEGPITASVAALDQDNLLRAILDIQSLKDDARHGWCGADTSSSGKSVGEMCPRDDLFQCGVWVDSGAPYALDARSRIARPPHAVLAPTNIGCEDQAPASLDCGGSPCHFLHCSPSACDDSSDARYLAATTANGSVYIFSLDSNPARAQAPVARLLRPFEGTEERVVGALAAADGRVVVLSETSVLLWSFASRTSAVLTNTSVDVSLSCMNAFGTQIVARQPWVSHTTALSTQQCGGNPSDAFVSTYCVVDITRKHVVRRLPRQSCSAWHKVFFCGNNAVTVEGNTLYRFSNETEPCGEASALFAHSTPPTRMVHDDLIECVASSEDGRLLAVSTGAVLWFWIAATGALLHRIETSRSTITALRFNPSGSHLLCQQLEGLYLWRTATGTCVTPLPNPFACVRASAAADATVTNPFPAHMGSVDFSSDGTKLHGCVGRFAVVWDAASVTPTAAVAPAQGLVSALCERNGQLFVASTDCGDVQVFTAPFPSLEQAQAGVPVTSNLLRNAKVSTDAMREVCVDPSGHAIACLDSSNRLRVFSLATGEPISWAGDGHDENGDAWAPVQSAAFLSADTLLYVPVHPDPQLLSAAAYTVGLGDSARVGQQPCLLPKELVYRTDSGEQPQLVVVSAAEAEEGGSFAGVEYSYRGHSRLIVLSVSSSKSAGLSCCLYCQLVGHSGPMLRSFFFGSFAFTVGAADGCVRLWSLQEQHRGAERTSYQHPSRITAATTDPCAPGVLLLLDAAGALHRVWVGNITSPTRASFLSRTVRLAALQWWSTAVGPVTGVAVAATPSLLCLRGASGSVALASAAHDGRVITVRPGSACRTLAAFRLGGRPCVALGLVDGRVVLGAVHQRREQPPRRGEDDVAVSTAMSPSEG